MICNQCKANMHATIYALNWVRLRSSSLLISNKALDQFLIPLPVIPFSLRRIVTGVSDLELPPSFVRDRHHRCYKASPQPYRTQAYN